MEVTGFDIPVVLFIFRRTDTVARILERLRAVRPRKLYLIADGGRDEAEAGQVRACRRAAEEGITWECEIVRNYAETNRGVYDQIGKGAGWVFEREDTAIFLEDDNLPEETFFPYCRELLDRYREDTRVLWINGTNYLGKYDPASGDSYMFTKHLLPCGWASWSVKFRKFYDGGLALARDPDVFRRLKETYGDPLLYRTQREAVQKTLYRMDAGLPVSWDFQMAFSLRIHGLYGISPSRNQIRNIGVDALSSHGGDSFRRKKTFLFCGMPSYPLDFPLRHPKIVITDKDYENRIGKIIRMRRTTEIGALIARKLVKPLLGIPPHASFREWIKAARARQR